MSARRPAPHKDDPRARILEAALATFAARGAEAASIAEVAASARMSKQALMHHYRTKDLLRAAVYQELSARFRAAFPEVAAELVRGAPEYARAIELVARRLTQAPAIARFMLFELLARPQETARWLRTEAAPWLGLVTGVIDQDRIRRSAAARALRLPHDEIDVGAHITVLAGSMLAVSALVPREDQAWWRRVNEALLRVLRLGSHLDQEPARPARRRAPPDGRIR